jgi:two-component system C4-dicarboxylate transport response regulator DctD
MTVPRSDFSGTDVRPPVLVIDDDPAMRAGLRQWMRLAGFEPVEASDAETALARIDAGFPGCIVSDVLLPGLSGVELLRKVKEIDADLPVILLTGHGDVSMAVEAMRFGAADFIEKPFDPDVLAAVVRRSAEHRRLVLENRALSRRLEDMAGLEARLLGECAEMRKLRAEISHYAATDASVMIVGETGTGKEVIARALAELSPRADAPFVALNCAALPETMVEAELFGHEAGAFTGAERARAGRIEQADGGVLFLDEISAMPMALQPKLLRVLQEREVDRIGGRGPTRVDIRRQCRSARCGRRKGAAAGPSLPAQRHRDPHSAAARARWRRAAAVRQFHQSLRRGIPGRAAAAFLRRCRLPVGVRLAGKRARAAQRRRALLPCRRHGPARGARPRARPEAC